VVIKSNNFIHEGLSRAWAQAWWASLDSETSW